MTLDPQTAIYIAQIGSGIVLAYSLWLSWRTYKFQRMEATIKANMQIALLTEIRDVLKKDNEDKRKSMESLLAYRDKLKKRKLDRTLWK